MLGLRCSHKKVRVRFKSLGVRDFRVSCAVCCSDLKEGALFFEPLIIPPVFLPYKEIINSGSHHTAYIGHSLSIYR